MNNPRQTPVPFANRRLFLAGASGAIGRQLVPLLRAAGWQIMACTRSADKLPLLRELGVEPVLLDVYDREALCRTLQQFQPAVVVHQLTDLPYALDSEQMAAALPRNARLRDEGTRNLVDAARLAGTQRFIAQSICFIYAEGALPHGEQDPLLAEDHALYGGTVIGVKSLERQVLAGPFSGIVLRYGLLYGPATGFDQPIAPGSVHVAAAAKAAELAICHGEAGIYNVAESDGAVSSERAIQQFGWDAGWRPEN